MRKGPFRQKKKQGSKIPQSTSTENAGTKTEKMRLIGFNVTPASKELFRGCPRGGDNLTSLVRPRYLVYICWPSSCDKEDEGTSAWNYADVLHLQIQSLRGVM